MTTLKRQAQPPYSGLTLPQLPDDPPLKMEQEWWVNYGLREGITSILPKWNETVAYMFERTLEELQPAVVKASADWVEAERAADKAEDMDPESKDAKVVRSRAKAIGICVLMLQKLAEWKQARRAALRRRAHPGCRGQGGRRGIR
jgi:hypothetical protein